MHYHQDNQEKLTGPVPINYRNDFPTFDLKEYFLNRDVRKALDSAILSLYKYIFSKNEIWKGEFEYRFVNDTNGLVSYDANKVIQLTIGEKLSDWQKAVLLEIAKNYENIQILEARMAKNKYQLELVQFEV